MIEELELSLKELYFMGKFMEGRYIDYSYIARMEDIEKNYLLYKQETLASLVEKGVLWEDFSGNVETEPAYLRLLHPIFFGEKETAVCMARILNTGRYTTSCRWHFDSDHGVLCEETDKGVCICLATEEKTKRILNGLFSDVSDSIPGKRIPTLSEIRADQVVSLKSVHLEKSAEVHRFIQEKGFLYRIQQDNSLVPMGKKQFLEEAMGIIWRK